MSLLDVLAIHRSPAYCSGDGGAILDAVLTRLGERGLLSRRIAERDIGSGPLPEASLYLSRAHGAAANKRLAELELSGAILLNRPAAVLSCHRRQLVGLFSGSRLAFPPSILSPTAGPARLDAERLGPLWGEDERIWIKRADVHAERPDDVVEVAPAALDRTFAAFAARGIPWVVVQKHVPGPRIAFWGVGGRRLFRWAPENGGERPVVDAAAVERLAFAAAALTGLEIFGGEMALPGPSRPVLLDLDDWPSFAPCRDDAAEAIAALCEERAALAKAPGCP